MRRWTFQPALVAALLASGAFRALAQGPVPDPAARRLLLRGDDQYRHRAFRAARQSLQRSAALPLLPTQPLPQNEAERRAYRAALAALRAGDSTSLEQALRTHDASLQPAYRQRLAAALSRYYFEHGDWGPAVQAGNEAGIANLSNDEIRDTKFQLAYAYFNNRQFAQAEPLFRAIRDVDGPYQAAGNYYYGLLAYHESRYDDALNSFLRIADLEAYRSTVPYYIAEIHYFKGDRETALKEALSLINRPDKLYYDTELHLLAAQCLFEAQRYGEALPYFEHYYERVDRLRKEELYEMAYCYYRVGEFDDAVEKFKPLSAAQDSLGQTAMYLLGDCYLKTGDKRGARTAFGLCAALPFNPGQREAALLLAAKLSYESGYNDEALGYLNTLLDDYPASKSRGEAATLRSTVLLRSGRYAEALQALALATPGPAYERAYQQATYGEALQQLRAGATASADSLLTLSLQHTPNKTYTAAARFWKADAAYRLGRYDDAVASSRAFLENPTVQSVAPDATPSAAWLNLGYAYLAQQNYAAAQNAFAEVRKRGGALAGDAALREADAALMQRQFAQAQALYEGASTASGSEGDYALLQRAILLGLRGQMAEKSTLLQTLLNRNPPSVYATDARYELALVRTAEGRYADAIELLRPLTTGGPLAPKALLRTGFAAGELNRDDSSVAAYRRILADYPAAPERTAALDALRAHYTERGQPEAYATLLDQYGLTNTAGAGLDSTFYAAAEGQFAARRWSEAARTFETYLTRYPTGSYALKAHYYVAVSYDRLGDTTAALRGYTAVLDAPESEFSLLAARRAVALTETRTDAGTQAYYAALLRLSTQTTDQQAAYAGLGRLALATGTPTLAAAYADTLLAQPAVPEAVAARAYLLRGNATAASGDTAQALVAWRSASKAKDPAVAAEAGYHTAAAELAAGRLDAATKEADRVVRIAGAPEAWTVRSYFILATVFTQQRDYFNAKATLQSIARNARDTALRAEASQQLAEVLRLEKQNSKLSGD